jgi:hypothetical protein
VLCYGSDAHTKARKKFVAAARLVVAFRPPAKDKHTVNKGDGEAGQRSAGPSFVLRAEATPAAAPPAPPVVTHGIAGADGLGEGLHQLLSSEDSVEGEQGLEKKHSMALSVMTDSVDDDESPSASRTESPLAQPGVVLTGGRDRSGRDRSGGRDNSGGRNRPRLEHKDTAGKKSMHAVPSKPALFDFKMADEGTAKNNRKGVSSFISKLKDRVGSTKAQALDVFVSAEDDEDDNSEVTSYFDHNAAPIFVEREKVEKHVLHSKRHDPKPEAKEYHRRRDDEDSVEEGVEETYFPGLGLGLGVGLDAEGSVKPITPGGIKPVKPNFDLSKFLATLSEEERAAMSLLPLEMINKIMESMNVGRRCARVYSICACTV